MLFYELVWYYILLCIKNIYETLSKKIKKYKAKVFKNKSKSKKTHV